MDLTLVELRESYKDAGARFTLAKEAIQEAEEGADLDALQAEFDGAETEFVSARDAYHAGVKKHEDARKRFELQEKAKDADKILTREDQPAPSVKREPLTYRKHGPHSLFQDMMRAERYNDDQAQERLNRHRREVEVERQVKFDLNSTDATGGQLVAPLYLQDEFVDLARAGRVVANVLGPRSLPPNTDTVIIPRLSTGVAVATQSDGGAVQETDASFDNVTGDVQTIAGMQDVSRQLLDRSVPGVDEVVFADLVKAYAVLLDGQVINSSTANNQGLLQVTGLNSVTYTSATPTVAGLYPKLADAIQQIHSNVFMEPSAVFMHPRRWGWILAALDGQNRPLITPYAPQNAAGAFGGVVSEGLVGSIQGLPIYVDANIPSTLGASTNEDRIIVVATPETYLYEESTGPFLETFPDVGSGTLTVRFRLHNYWAQINNRRPKAISVISGTGLAAPTF
jgi:HK97 family phage major capsid protein